MTAPIFVDTNIFVYARDARDSVKQSKAYEVLSFLWRTKLGRVSFQVLNEYYVTVTKKLQPGLERESARADVQDLLAWNPMTHSASTIHQAFDIESRYSVSWWDSLIVSSAIEAECDTVYSEDLQHGMLISGVTVLNPFHIEFALPILT